MRTRAVATGLVFMLLPLLGCGDDGPSKEDFIAAGDDICLDLRRELDAVQLPAPNAGPEEVQAYLDEVRPIVEQGQRDWNGVEASEDDDGEQLKEDVVATLDDQLAKLDDVEAAVQSNDAAATQEAVQQLEEQGDDTDARLQRYGFEECGRQD
jgi:hypothetical protein